MKQSLEESQIEFAKERRMIATQLLSISVNEAGAIVANESQIREAFGLADQILAFGDEATEKDGPVRVTDEVLDLFDWVLTHLHKMLHGQTKAATWRTCGGGFCTNARNKLEKIDANFVKPRDVPVTKDRPRSRM